MVKTPTRTRRPTAAPITVQQPPRAAMARRLDLLADLHLQQGFVGSAERLAYRAAALREVRR